MSALREAVAAVEEKIDAECQDAPAPCFEENDYEAGYIAGLAFAQDLLRELLKANPAKPEDLPPVVEEFINERPQFVKAAREAISNDTDYMRWQGHMEARRHLAERLSYSTPTEPEDRTHHVEAKEGQS